MDGGDDLKYYIVTDSSDFVGFTKNMSLALEYLKNLVYRAAESNLPCDPKLLEVECSSVSELTDYCNAEGIDIYGDNIITVYDSGSSFANAHVVGTSSDTLTGENSLLSFLERFVIREDISNFRKAMHFVLWLKENGIIRDENLLKSIWFCTVYLINATDTMLNSYDECAMYLDDDNHIDIVMYGIWKKWWVNMNG